MNYETMLEKALSEFDSFSLVWRDEFEFNAHCAAIEQSLHPFLINETRTDEWPGTKIFEGLATVRFYKIEEGSIAVLRNATDFRDWMAPDRPEDLAFYKSGDVVYGSIAHEKDEWWCE